MKQHLGQGAHRRQDGGKHVVAEDLDQLAEARHALVELGGFLSAEAAGIIGHRHFQQLFDAEGLRTSASWEATMQSSITRRTMAIHSAAR